MFQKKFHKICTILAVLTSAEAFSQHANLHGHGHGHGRGRGRGHEQHGSRRAIHELNYAKPSNFNGGTGTGTCSNKNININAATATGTTRHATRQQTCEPVNGLVEPKERSSRDDNVNTDTNTNTNMNEVGCEREPLNGMVVQRPSKQENIGRKILAECTNAQEDMAGAQEEQNERDDVDNDIDNDNDAESKNDTRNEGSGEEDEEMTLQRRRRAAMAAKLLKKGSSPVRSRSGSVSESNAKKASARDTSVGSRREGSASRMRSRSTGARGGGLSGQILKGIRGTAAAAVAAKKRANKGTAASVKDNMIQSTIDVLINAQNELRSVEKSSMGLLGSTRKGIGHGADTGLQHLDLPTKPLPGTILMDRLKGIESGTNILSKQRIRENTIVRVAAVEDDEEIAKLRLSVFSDFSPEVRREFHTRSCEVLGHRRMKGATCLVASVDYSDAGMEFEREKDSEAHSWVIGTLECSSYEFSGTQLGMRRPSGSILYVTEVAVSPRARRTGAGTKLLEVRIRKKKRKRLIILLN